jgi:hypothetical protein
VSSRSPLFTWVRGLRGAGQSEAPARCLPWVAVGEPSPAQGMNDLLNCGCQILDGDLRATVDASQALSCSAGQWQLRSDPRGGGLQAFGGPASALLFTCSCGGEVVDGRVCAVHRWQGFTRHGLPSFRCNAPLTDCLKRASQAKSESSHRRTASVLTLSPASEAAHVTSVVTAAPTATVCARTGFVAKVLQEENDRCRRGPAL